MDSLTLHSITQATYSCPIEATIKIIGGKYKPIILWNLVDKTLRHSELCRLAITARPRMLTAQLREMESNGLIVRVVYPIVPSKVEYFLSDFGKTVIPILQSMCNWGSDYIKKMFPEILNSCQSDIKYKCPVGVTVKLIGGKYKPIILWNLIDKTLRSNELHKFVPTSTHKMYTQHLRELERDGLIDRKVYPVSPPKVEYTLSSLGRTIVPVLETMCDWGNTYYYDTQKK